MVRTTLIKKRLKGLVWAIIRDVIIAGLCFIIIYPFISKISNSFKTYTDFLDPTVRFIPKNFTLDNIKLALERMSYGKALLNTTIICGSVAAITTLISSFVGYGIARFQFKGRALLYFFVIFTLIVPPQTVIIPLFLRFKSFLGINLLGTPFPVIVLAFTGLSLKNGLYIFLLRQFFANMPKELEEAAYLDGCGAYQTFARIMLPGSRTMLLTVFLLALAWQWTDVVYSSLFLKDTMLLANVVNLAAVGEQIKVVSANLINIATLMAVLPLAIIYLITQKLFVQSMERAGIVG